MIRIVTDSVASLSPEEAAARDIIIMPLYLNFDGAEHVETEMDIDGFYESIGERIDDIPTSSQPSALAFEEVFEEAADAGDSVLGIFISSKLSGTFDGAIRAARTAKSHHLDFTCILIDSVSTGYDEAAPVLDAVDARDEGRTLEECAAAVENAIACSRILFVPESLDFLKAGGRIGAASALVGSLIKITPVLTVLDGTPCALEKVRTVKKAVEAMIDRFRTDVDRHGLKRVMVHYIGSKTEILERFRKRIEEIAGHEVSMRPVSPVIGSHVGPAIGIAYECLSALDDKVTFPVSELTVIV